MIDGVVRIFASDGSVTYEGGPQNTVTVLETNCEGGDQVYVTTLPLPQHALPAFAQRLAPE